MRMKTARVDFSVTGTEVAPTILVSLSNFDLRILMTWQRKKMLIVMTIITGTASKYTEDLQMEFERRQKLEELFLARVNCNC